MAKKPEFEQPLESVTKEERRDATSIFPQKIKIVNGCPTKEVKAVNDVVDTFVKISRKQSKRAEQAMEVNDWLFQGIHDSLNPKNIGVVEQYWVENPDFDKSKPESDENPFLVADYRHKYDPQRYKENTISAAVQTNLKGYEDLLKKIQTVEKESRIQLAKDNREMMEQKSSEVIPEEEEYTSLISLDFDESDNTVIN